LESDAAVSTGSPSKETLTRAINAAKFMRRNTRLRNTGAALLALIVIAAAATILLAKEAIKQKSVAKHQMEVAQAATRHANMAAAEMRKSEQERQDSLRARDKARLDLTNTLKDKSRAEDEAKSFAASATKSKALSESMDLARESGVILPISPERALALAVEAMQKGVTPAAESALIQASSAFVPFQRIRAESGGGVFNSDGSLFAVEAASGIDSPIEVWNAARIERVNKVSFPYRSLPLGFAASNRVVVGWIEPQRARYPHSNPDPTEVPLWHEDSWALSPDGQLAASLDGGASVVRIFAWNGGLRFSISLPSLVFTASGGGLKRVASCAFLPKSAQLLVVGADGHIYLVDVAQQRVEREAMLEGQPKGRIQLRPQADLFAVAVGTPSGWGATNLELWRTNPLEKVELPRECSGADIAFSEDGQMIAVDKGGTVNVCDFDAGTFSLQREITTESVFGLQFARNGTLLVRGDREAHIYDATTGETRATLRGSGRALYGALIAPNAEIAATWSTEHEVRLWDIRGVPDRNTYTPFNNDPNARWLASSISPNGRTVVRVGPDGTIWRLNENLQAVGTTAGCEPEGTSEMSGPAHVSWDSSGEQFVVQLRTGTMMLVNASTGAMTELPFFGQPTTLSLDRNGRFVVRYDNDDGLAMCDVIGSTKHPTTDGERCAPTARAKTMDPRLCKRIKVEDYVGALALSPDASLIAANVGPIGDRGLAVLERTTHNTVLKMPGHQLLFSEVAFSPTGKYLAATAELDGSLTSWEITDGPPWRFRRRATIRDARLRERMAISVDGRLLAGRDFHDRLNIWDAELGILIKQASLPFAVSEGGSFIGNSLTFRSLLDNSIRTDECRTCRPVLDLLGEARHNLLVAARCR
jgi:WD40 repeat protein